MLDNPVVVISLAVVGLLIAVFLFWMSMNKINNDQAIDNHLKDKSLTKRLNLWNEAIAFNEDQKVFYHVRPDRLYEIPFSKIIGVEVETDGNSVTKNSINGAVVGAVLAGGIGALIGSGMKGKTKTVIESITMKITVDSLENPIHKITFFVRDSETTSAALNNAIEKVDSWNGIMNVILERNKKELAVNT